MLHAFCMWPVQKTCELQGASSEILVHLTHASLTNPN
jgi:hypothetical protein